MKTIRTKTLLLSALLSVGLVSTAAARPGGHGPRFDASCKSPRHLAMLAKYDANKDGALDRTERQAIRADKKAAALAKYDANRDGKLDRAERQTLRHERTVEMFEEIDTSGDAEISPAEAEAACGPLKRHFARVDTDGDGQISWTEFEAKVKKHPGKRGKRGKHGKRGKRAGAGQDT